MKYLAVLGRQPELSRAELEALGVLVGEVRWMKGVALAELETEVELDINRLGGTQEIGVLLTEEPLEVLLEAPEGKITFGISDFAVKDGTEVIGEALRWKGKLVKAGRSVRVVESKTGVLPTATSLHNGLAGKNPRKVEFLHFAGKWYRVIGVQDIDAYAKRDQKRPARDAKIGMLPPKLAQILINLAGALPPRSRILDPFCGTGVVLQEAILMGLGAYGTDIDPRMVRYAQKNLEWLIDLSNSSFADRKLGRAPLSVSVKENSKGLSDSRDLKSLSFSDELFTVEEGDATNYQWEEPIDAVVTEGYLGRPFTEVPTGVEVKKEILECKTLIARFLKNLASQITAGTPVVMAWPAWLRENGEYLRLNMLDEIEKLGYNVENKTREGLLYHREGQIVARDIIILRKK